MSCARARPRASRRATASASARASRVSAAWSPTTGRRGARPCRGAGGDASTSAHSHACQKWSVGFQPGLQILLRRADCHRRTTCAGHAAAHARDAVAGRGRRARRALPGRRVPRGRRRCGGGRCVWPQPAQRPVRADGALWLTGLLSSQPATPCSLFPPTGRCSSAVGLQQEGAAGRLARRIGCAVAVRLVLRALAQQLPPGRVQIVCMQDAWSSEHLAGHRRTPRQGRRGLHLVRGITHHKS